MRFSRTALLVGLCTCAGCGELAGFDLELPPIIEVGARVSADASDVQALIDIHRALDRGDDVPPSAWTLRTALLWVTAPHIPALCNDEIYMATGACPPPSVVAPFAASAALPAAVGEDLRVVSHVLPPLTVGPDLGSDRLTFGSAVMFLDTNGNQQYDPWDRIIAASWHDNALSHARISVREGSDPRLSLDDYYPPPSECPELPRGASVLRWRADQRECAVDALPSEPIDLHLLTVEQEAVFQCAWNAVDTYTYPPDAFLFENDSTELEAAICAGENSFVLPRLHEAVGGYYQPTTLGGEFLDAFGSRVCPHLMRVSLRGCYDERYCDGYEWDYTDFPPEWWPC